MWLLLGTVVALVAFLVWLLKPRPIPGVPHPDGYGPILGDVPALTKNLGRFFQWHVETSEKHKKTWQISVPGRQSNLKLVDAACVQHILKTNMANYEKTRVSFDNEIFYELTGNLGLLIAAGSKWRAIRKTTSHLFAQRVVTDIMVKVFLKNARHVIHKLETIAGDKTKHLDVQDTFFRFTLDSFSEISLGTDPGALKMEGPHEFSEAFDRIQHRCFARRLEPEVVFRLKKAFGSKDEKQMAADHRVINEWAESGILRLQAQAKSLTEEKGGRSSAKARAYQGNLVSLFLSAAAEKKEPPPNLVWLRDQIVSIMLAGRDTTAALLTSLFQLLATHPAEEERLIQEIDDKLRGEMPSHENVGQLKFADAVFTESLRLFPSAPLDFRKALKDDVLPDGTPVPAGTEVQYVPWVMGRDKRVFKDPDHFIPQRWIDSAAEIDPSKRLPGASSFQWPAFNAGPRSCLGKNMSYLEAKLLICTILQRFRLGLVPGQDLQKLSLGLTLVRSNGQLMYAERRTDSPYPPQYPFGIADKSRSNSMSDD